MKTTISHQKEQKMNESVPAPFINLREKLRKLAFDQRQANESQSHMALKSKSLPNTAEIDLLPNLDQEGKFIGSHQWDENEDKNSNLSTNYYQKSECIEEAQSENPCRGEQCEQSVSHQQSRPQCELGHMDEDFLYGKNICITTVNNSDYQALFQLRCLCNQPAKPALASFIKRCNRSTWMKNQWKYRERAALAAAHDCQCQFKANGLISNLPVSGFKGVALLNCRNCTTTLGKKHRFYPCNQPFYCPSCNFNARVKPAIDEFVPVMKKAKKWYGVTVVGRANPEDTGVKILLSTSEDKRPTIKWLYRLTDHSKDLREFKKFGLNGDFAYPMELADSLCKWANWLTDNSYFDGLHIMPECDFNFFPKADSFLGVDHTIHCHLHGYGNASCELTEKCGERIYRGALRSFTSGKARDLAYPDILLIPAEDEESLKRTINYSIKPINIVDIYTSALNGGCPVKLLNLVFFQTVFGCEELFPISVQGAKYGNMSQKSRSKYIGIPRKKLMSPLQLKRFFEKGEQASPWEFDRYERHLEVEKYRAPSPTTGPSE